MGALFYFAMTLAATVATLPLIAFYFQRISLVGLPATALVLPAVPAVLMAQAAAGVAGAISTTLAQPLGWVAWLVTGYVTGVVGLVARLPGASFETGRIGHVFVWLYYGAIAGSYAIISLRGSLGRFLEFARRPSLSPVSAGSGSWWLTVPVILTGLLVWTAALTLDDGTLSVAILDVGQGDAAFIVTPSGQQILVDGGPDGDRLMHLIGERMAFMDRTIEMVVLTHPHSDHVTGLIEALRRYDVKRMVERRTQFDSPQHQAWRRAVEREGAEVLQAEAGQVIATGDGMFIQVVAPSDRLLQGTQSDVDNASIVLRLVYGDVSMMLTGDMFDEAERALVSSGAAIDSDVLKVGHHGSRSSSSGPFLGAGTPAIAVVSAGEDNLFGHPHRETLDALRRWVPDDGLFLTAERGVVEFTTDGRRLWVKTDR